MVYVPVPTSALLMLFSSPSALLMAPTGKGIANPVGAIRSAAMMVEWLGEPEKARRIEAAVQKALAAVKTPDLGGSSKTEDVTRVVVENLMIF